MKSVWTIFRKELKDSLRDHRTVMTMLVIPLLIVPVAMNFLGRMDPAQGAGNETQLLRVGIVSFGNAHDFEWTLRSDDKVFVVRMRDESEALDMLNADLIDAAVLFDKEFDAKIEQRSVGNVEVMYSHLGTQTDRARINNYLRSYEQSLLSTRFAAFSAPSQWAQAFQLQERKVTRPEDILSRMMAGLMPYIVIIFAFLGCMYPALDLGAGEKERGTMETLLTAPTSRMEIVLGKFGVVVVAGMVSALVAIFGMWLGLLPHADSGMVATMRTYFELPNLMLKLILLVPLTMFFGAILLTVSVYARSFKEAQSIITPLTMVAIFPAGMALIPSIELGVWTALVPVLNVSLATKAIVSGSLTFIPFLLILLSLAVVSASALHVCNQYFARESVIFRTA